MKKTIWIIFILGVIAICSFFTPISQGGMTQRGYYVYEYGVQYSSILDTHGRISEGRFALFLAVWAIICYSVSMLLQEFKKQKSVN